MQRSLEIFQDNDSSLGSYETKSGLKIKTKSAYFNLLADPFDNRLAGCFRQRWNPPDICQGRFSGSRHQFLPGRYTAFDTHCLHLWRQPFCNGKFHFDLQWWRIDFIQRKLLSKTVGSSGNLASFLSFFILYCQSFPNFSLYFTPSILVFQTKLSPSSSSYIAYLWGKRESLSWQVFQLSRWERDLAIKYTWKCNVWPRR